MAKKKAARTSGKGTTTPKKAGKHVRNLSEAIEHGGFLHTSIHLRTAKETRQICVDRGLYAYTAIWSKDLRPQYQRHWQADCKTLKAAMTRLIACFPKGVPLPETVTATGKVTVPVNGKATVLKPKQVAELTLAAWMECFGAPVPDAAGLRMAKEAARDQTQNQRDKLSPLLRTTAGMARLNKQRHLDWKALNPFKGYDLSKAKLDGMYSGDVHLAECSLDGASLIGADLSYCSFERSTFRKANLTRLEGTYANFNDCDFSGANLSEAELTTCKLLRAKLAGANLKGADLRVADLRGADLTRARLDKVQWLKARFDAATLFPAGFKIPDELTWKGKGIDPRASAALQAAKSGGPIDLPQFMQLLESTLDKDRLKKAVAMLKADRFRLFAESHPDHLLGVVKSQTDADLVYSCRLSQDGVFGCCTQNLNICGGLRGSLCKHLLVLILGMAKAGELDPSKVNQWILASKYKKPELNKDAMSETLLKFKGAEAGDIDWRPTETIPEDFYAL